MVKDSSELTTRNQDGHTALEILRDTQKPTWGKYQEAELLRACDRGRSNNCSIM